MYVCVYVCVRGPARFLSGRSLLYFSVISFSKAKFILYEKPQQAKGEKNTHTHTRVTASNYFVLNVKTSRESFF